MPERSAKRRVRRTKGSGSLYQRADGRWIGTIEAGYTPAGTRSRIVVTAATRAKCATKLKTKQRTIAADGLPSPDAAQAPTVAKWGEAWLTRRADLVAPATYISDKSAVTKWIIPTIGRKRLDSLTPADVRAVAGAHYAAGGAQRSVHRTHGTLSKLLTDAVAEGYLIPARVRETPGPAKGTSGRDALPLDDAIKVLEAAARRPDVSRWVAALLQGVRPAEALGLTWDRVDFDQGVMVISWQLKRLPRNAGATGFRVPRSYETRHLTGAWHLVRPKTAAGVRIVPMVPWMAAALHQWQEIAPKSPYGLVWPGRTGAPKTEKTDRNDWHEICNTAAVTVLEPDGTSRPPLLYEARHTAATLLLAAGVDETTIKAILGHSTVISTKTYLHADQARTRAALTSVAARLGLTEAYASGN